MPGNPDQVLTVAQMRAAEQDLIGRGTNVDALMQIAGQGAADYVWRIAAGGAVTVLCGPGNNGGDGYVIAEAIRQRGGTVQVVAAAEPATLAALSARKLYRGSVIGCDSSAQGTVFVDCLFGSGLTRPLSAELVDLLEALAGNHTVTIAIDVPSGVDSDQGAALNTHLPVCDLTLALGAWKFAHFLMPARQAMGALCLIPIGVAAVSGAAEKIVQPQFCAPSWSAHKYSRGMLGVIAGAMQGAALLACHAAQRAGAGYVKLIGDAADLLHPDLVTDRRPLAQALSDSRFNAVLVGPGLGRDGAAAQTLMTAIKSGHPLVFDADALHLLQPAMLAACAGSLIATPHDGEFGALERAFGLSAAGSKVQRARSLAQRSGMIIVAKGADTVVAAADGRCALAAPGSSWLSTAGTGDVLAGAIAGRLASGAEPFLAACQGVWLHGEAARRCPPPFTANDLVAAVRSAYAATL